MRSNPSSLFPIFRSRHQGELLATLLLHPDRQYSMTELANQLKAPLTTVQREVQRLIAADVLVQQRMGRSRMISANTRSPYTTPLTSIAMRVFGPQVVVREEFEDLSELQGLAIYGSWAARYSGENGPPPNDVDVLVIGEPSRVAVYEAADRAERRLDLPVNPTIRTQQAWDEAADALTRELKADPLVWLIRLADTSV